MRYYCQHTKRALCPWCDLVFVGIFVDPTRTPGPTQDGDLVVCSSCDGWSEWNDTSGLVPVHPDDFEELDG